VKQAITAVKPDAVLYAETPSVARQSDPPPALDAMCDGSYSHNLLLNLRKVLQEGSDDLLGLLAQERIEHGAIRARFLETHDTPRIAATAPDEERPLVVLISTVPGVPMIQAGQEIGATKRYGPELAVDWQHGNQELWQFHQKVFGIRSQHAALKRGTIINAWRSGAPIQAYTRSFEGQHVVVALNFQSQPASAVLRVPFPARTVVTDLLQGGTFTVDDPQQFSMTVPGRSARILAVADKRKDGFSPRRERSSVRAGGGIQ
jgi:hypothetical protein